MSLIIITQLCKIATPNGKTKAAGGGQRLCFLEEKENGEKAGKVGISFALIIL